MTLENAFTNTTGILMAPPKAAGSLLLARQISQGNPVSVFISVARPAVQPLYLGNESSGWAIAFATDQMALAYTNASLQNPEASTALAAYNSAAASNTTAKWNNFFSVLSSGSVKVGFGNPNADPAGYRGWIVLEAAGQAFGQNSSSFVNRIIFNGGNVTGSSAADLVGPLETGQIQFLFIYKSAAIAHKLNYLHLPDQVNLGSTKYSKFYAEFSYKLTSGAQKGGLVALYITVPKDSTDTPDSLQFVVFVVKNSPTLLSSYGLVPLSPARLYNSTTVPEPLQELITEGYLEPSGTL
jgi:molybdate/tungstate transport system substrate-binding protein